MLLRLGCFFRSCLRSQNKHPFISGARHMNGQAITVTIFTRNLCALFNLLINLLLRLNRMYIYILSLRTLIQLFISII